MIRLPEVITAGGTASLVFELTDAKHQRLTNVNGIATVSLRRAGTSRTRHELTHLPAALDSISATVTLVLSTDQTTALSPPISAIGKQRRNDVIGDVRIVHGQDVDYYGPFAFTVRLPETYEGQAIPVLTLNVMGGLSTDNVPNPAEITLDQVGHNILFPAYADRYLLIWRLASEPDLISVVYASDSTRVNLLGAWSLWPNLVTLADGREGKVLLSNQLLTDVADTLELA